MDVFNSYLVNSLDKNGIKMLCNGLKYLCNLLSLNIPGMNLIKIDNSNIKNDGIKIFSMNLKYFKNLRELNIGRILLKLRLWY